MGKFKWKLSIRKEVRVFAALVGVSFLIAFSERKQDDVRCTNIVVELENIRENHYMDEADVLRLVYSTHLNAIGSSLAEIDLKGLENKLEYDSHIEDAQLYGDLKGNLVAKVKLRRPVARIIRMEGADAYIAEDGTIMSVSGKYTSRVVLISGAFGAKLMDAGNAFQIEEGAQLMEMIEFINQDDFWKSQVAQMDINSAGKITIYPQITGQRVQFGLPDNFEEKFTKLMIFYKEILPSRGWTKYERVNLEFAGQVVAE
jgi:cell division protein FtsQ